MNKIKPPKTSIPQKLATTTGDNDANNNRHRSDAGGFKTYRIPQSRNRTVRVSTVEKAEIAAVNSNKLPQPCKTCGRIDQPERFHSHPETPPVVPRKMSEKPAVIKNSVQKPVAIKYKSKLTEKRKVVASAAPVKKSAENIAEIRKNAVENYRKTVSAKGPRTLTCYICGREFGTMSLPLHEPKCLEVGNDVIYILVAFCTVASHSFVYSFPIIKPSVILFFLSSYRISSDLHLPQSLTFDNTKNIN